MNYLKMRGEQLGKQQEEFGTWGWSTGAKIQPCRTVPALFLAKFVSPLKMHLAAQLVARGGITEVVFTSLLLNS